MKKRKRESERALVQEEGVGQPLQGSRERAGRPEEGKVDVGQDPLYDTES